MIRCHKTVLFYRGYVFVCPLMCAKRYVTLQWHHNEDDVFSNHQASRLFAQPFVQAQVKENIKAPRHLPLLGESTGDRWIPLTKDH